MVNLVIGEEVIIDPAEPASISRCTGERHRRSRTQRVCSLRYQFEQTHVWMWGLAVLWNRMKTRSFDV